MCYHGSLKLSYFTPRKLFLFLSYSFVLANHVALAGSTGTGSQCRSPCSPVPQPFTLYHINVILALLWSLYEKTG